LSSAIIVPFSSLHPEASKISENIFVTVTMATSNNSLRQMAILLLQEFIDTLSPAKPEPTQESEAISNIQSIMAKNRPKSSRDSPQPSPSRACWHPSPSTFGEASHSRISKPNKKKTNSKAVTVTAKRARDLHQRLQTGDWKFPHPVEGSPLLEIDNMNDHGRGVRTTVPNIPAGTLLLVESPLINKFKTKPKATYNERLEAVVLVLDAKDKELFAQLAWNDADDIFESRVKPNSFEVSADSLSLYKYISFINHSCRPNCRLEGGLQKDTFLVRTMVPIQDVGTEITIDYWPERRLDDVKTRQEELKECWGFICDCEACLDPNQSNITRERISELQKEVRCKMEDYSPKELPSLAIVNENMTEYIQLLRQEHFIDRISQAHQRAIQVYEKSSRPIDIERVLMHHSQLVEVQRALKGFESDEAFVAAKDYVTAMKSCRAYRADNGGIWGSKRHFGVAGSRVATGRVEKSPKKNRR
jgi:hypothetical protein